MALAPIERASPLTRWLAGPGLGAFVVTLELNDDDALVLFDLLARNDERDNVSAITELSFEDAAERYALCHVHGALERTLVEPFRDDYRDPRAVDRVAH